MDKLLNAAPWGPCGIWPQAPHYSPYAPAFLGDLDCSSLLIQGFGTCLCLCNTLPLPPLSAWMIPPTYFRDRLQCHYLWAVSRCAQIFPVPHISKPYFSFIALTLVNLSINTTLFFKFHEGKYSSYSNSNLERYQEFRYHVAFCDEGQLPWQPGLKYHLKEDKS